MILILKEYKEAKKLLRSLGLKYPVDETLLGYIQIF